MTLFSGTPALISLLLLYRKPWKAQSWIRKSTGLMSLAFVGLIFLIAAVGGTPEYLEEQFGWFVGLDDFGPRAIVQNSDGYVVVGDDSDDNGVVWLSSTGKDWQRAPQDEILERLNVGDVIVDQTGLIMVAQDDKRGSVITLTSNEGQRWVREAVDGEAGKPKAVVINDGNLVIVGSSYSNDGIFYYGNSENELLLAEPKPHIDRDREPIEVFVHGDGFLSAVNHKSDAVIFMSGEGKRWAEHLRFGNAVFSSMTEYKSGYIAVGRDRSEKSAAIWISSDGTDWTQSLLPNDSEGTRLDVIVAHQTELLLIGHRDSDNQVVSWRSVDGVTWESVPTPFGDAVIRDAVIDDARAVVVGVDRALNATAIWTRDDSSDWTRVPHDDMLFNMKQ